MSDYYDEYDDYDQIEEVSTKIIFGDVNTIYDRIKQKIENIGMLLDLDQEKTLLILKYYQWDQEKLESCYFDDIEKTLIQAGVQP